MTIGARASSLGPLLAGWLAASAMMGCGGSVTRLTLGSDGGAGDDSTDAATDPRCPEVGTLTGYEACSVAGLTCPTGSFGSTCDGSVRFFSCTCDGQLWSCEVGIAGSPCEPACPSSQSVTDGQACPSNGQVCPSDNLRSLDCSGQPTGVETLGDCTCRNGAWSCPEVGPPPCATTLPTCPDPSMVVPGQKCSAPVEMVCSSTNVPGCLGVSLASDSCTCDSGVWTCGGSASGCMQTTCPDPSAVSAYGTCFVVPSVTCTGDPQYCGGGLYYDTFRCTDGNYWQQVTTTNCAIGNDPDGGLGDASFGYDAGAVDAF